MVIVRSPLLALPLAAVFACSSQALPGTILGKYSVVGTSTTNTCGSGLNAPNPWDFTVEISKDGSTLYWSWLDDNPPVSGSLDSSSSTTISASQTANVDATDAGAGPCTMERDDTLTVTLGSGATPTTLTGTITYAFNASSGADCTDQLSASAGTYAVLPCAMSYSLSGTKQ